MATNLIALRSKEDFLAGYTPGYTPILPLLLGNSQKYEMEVGQAKLNRLNAIGDLRGKVHGPKDTELHQIHAKLGGKTFNRYVFASQFIISNFQDRQGIEDVQAQALDEQNKQADELLLTAEGTDNASAKNNGLYFSNDPNYTLNSSAALASTGNNLPALYNKVAEVVEQANQVAGDKLVLFYGEATSQKLNGLFVDTNTPFRRTLEDGIDADFNKIPKDLTPANELGFIVVNLAQVKLHYITLPQILAQGINEEKMYAWTNFVLGSSMVEVIAKGGVIRQPITFS